jgi:hypothetical protein
VNLFSTCSGTQYLGADGACHNAAGAGVTSFSGDGTIITNSASTGAVTATIAGTSGGVPYFSSTSAWASSALLANNTVVLGGGSGSAPKTAVGVTVPSTGELDAGTNGGTGGTFGLNGATSGKCTGAVDATGANLIYNCNLTPSGSSSVGTSSARWGGTSYLSSIDANGSLIVFNIFNHNNSHIWLNTTAPSIAAAGCGGSGASITANNGPFAFRVNVGTSNTGSCAITLPASTGTGWNCFATDITTTSTAVSSTKQSGAGSSTSVTLQNYTDISGTGAWTDSDVLIVTCAPL